MGFDRLRLDSYGGRFTMLMDSSWVVSAGYGFLKSPESLDPSESMQPRHGVVLHGRKLGMDGQIATSVIWGANRHSEEPRIPRWPRPRQSSIAATTILGRVELVQKSAEDLVLPTGPGGFAPDSTFTVAAVSVGYIREVARMSKATLGPRIPGNAEPRTNRAAAVLRITRAAGGMLFLRIRPPMGHMRCQARCR